MATQPISVSGSGKVDSRVFHAPQNAPGFRGRTTRLPQVAGNVPVILAENVAPAMKRRIVDLFLEGLVSRKRHGLELSTYVLNRIGSLPGFNEKLVDDVIGITLSEIRTELAVYHTELTGLPRRAREAAAEATRTI